jgi:hypothetical protein
MCNVDYDRPDFYVQDQRRARREHKCGECGRTIAKGEFYVRSSGKWDGLCNSFKHCEHCAVLAAWLERECGGYMHGGIIEDIGEHLSEYRVPAVGFSLARLYVMAGRDWKRRGQLVQVPPTPARTLHEAQP